MPAAATVYVLGTPDGRHRGAMLAVIVAMAAVGLFPLVAAPVLARSRLRVPVQLFAVVVTTVGTSGLALLDGGVTSPLGALELYSLTFFAVVLPARLFAPMALLCLAAYATVAVAGSAAPPGFAWVFVCTYGGVAWLAMRHTSALAAMRHRLAEVSQIDALTGCLNRRGFDERLEAEFTAAAGRGGRVTLLLADLDRFKEVNDRYGHRGGDDLLAWTGRALARRVRDGDAVGRIGGDEFAAVLVDADGADAQSVVDRVRADLDPVSPASLGCASYPDDGETLAALRQLADERVYADKLARHAAPGSRTPPARPPVPAGRRATPAVSGRERRRRSVADGGRLAVSVSGVGLGYILLFAAGHPHRLAIGVLLGTCCVLGTAVIAAADRLSRSAGLRGWMAVFGLVELITSAFIVALSGGATTALAVGLLAPLPLIALSTPPRVGVPLVGVTSGFYVAVGFLVGATSPWHVATHLGGSIALAVACGLQGAEAGRQRRRLTRLSRTDALTDTLNRRGFEERFAARTAGADAAFSLLILDLDRFKEVNDRYGHAAGDELLAWVAGTLRAVLPPSDVVGRLGGDEFVVLLASTDAASAADRLTAALAERTAVSIGTARLGVHGRDFESLYAHADAELYARKRRRIPAARAGRETAPAALETAPAGPEA
ncbi:diguanylate cyclase domain-containing protein [Couchioplanes caeruleus subsp. azureus]|uniref:diguanylate cyclase domain-containing protein n=1 Tax=Couchioplanes caeruleus TaxID=56438 RepID=UPI0036229792